MPELPEVETVKRGLLKLVVGKVVATASFDTARSFPNAPSDVRQFLVGAKIIDIRRRAKVLMIDLSTSYTLVIHLKMTGQLVFVDKEDDCTPISPERLRTGSDKGPGALSNSGCRGSGETRIQSSLVQPSRFGGGHPTDSLIHQLPDKSTRVTFEFHDGSHLYFNDQRKFGWVRLMPTIEVPNIDFMKRVGPEPLEDDFTVQQFTERFARKQRSNIKAALLDQSVIAGIGNIYADESLWGAQIHPKRLVASLKKNEFEKLYTEIRYVMNLSIEKGGSTNRNYVNAEGKKGSYMDFARVFRREGLACPVCGSEIVKIRVAGRGTHFCPICQKK